MIPNEIIDEILDRTDLVSLISEFVSLKKAGRNYKGLCPFHQEKSPSFTVQPEKKLFYCFGCGEGGNAFGFLMKIQNLPFLEAAEELARKGGIDLDRYQTNEGSGRREKEVFYKINKYAAWFFKQQLQNRKGEIAQNYLKKRGVTDKTAELFGLGYAVDSWNGLVNFFKDKKVPLEEAGKLGLIRKKGDGTYYDFFRNRLIFPITDGDNRVIGFGGRRLDESQEAKYINSQESPIYYKGMSIYGIGQAKKSIREKGEVVLVEGYLDLITLHQGGITHVVAPLGTALTPLQVKTLKRFSEKMVLMFDGDSAGIRAAERAVTICFEAEIHPRIVILPEKQDPDSFVRQKGDQALLDEINKAPLAMDWLFLKCLEGSGSPLSQKIEGAKRMIPFLEALPTELEQKSYRARLSQFLGMAPEELERIKKKTPPTAPQKQAASDQKNQKNSLERILLELYVREPFRIDPLLGEEIFQKFENEQIRNLGLRLKREFLQKGKWAFEKLIDPANRGEAGLIANLALAEDASDSSHDENTIEKMARDCLDQWNKKQLKNDLKKITDAIQIAEFKNDHEVLKKLMIQKNEVAKQIKL